MPDIPGFQRKQYAFAAHIRDPEHNAAPGDIEDRRMSIYRELFFNNLNSLLSGTFPVLKKISSDEKWRALVRQFMVKHEAQTPYFLEIPQEFVTFLQQEFEPADDDFPFLVELAHYEWVELALSISEADNDFAAIDPHGDLLEGAPVKSALAWVFAYTFPVHQISTEFLPEAPGEQPTYLAVFRKADDDLGFMLLNPVTARLLELIEQADASRTGRELLLELAAEIAYPEPETLVAHGAEAMEEMRRSEILLGTSRKHRTEK